MCLFLLKNLNLHYILNSFWNILILDFHKWQGTFFTSLLTSTLCTDNSFRDPFPNFVLFSPWQYLPAPFAWTTLSGILSLWKCAISSWNVKSCRRIGPRGPAVKLAVVLSIGHPVDWVIRSVRPCKHQKHNNLLLLNKRCAALYTSKTQQVVIIKCSVQPCKHRKHNDLFASWEIFLLTKHFYTWNWKSTYNLQSLL